jgi:hypothetical protein
MTRAYTDNTNAAEPPGGKRHDPSLGRENLLPPEQGLERPARTKTARKTRTAQNKTSRKKKPASSGRRVSSRAK